MAVGRSGEVAVFAGSCEAHLSQRGSGISHRSVLPQRDAVNCLRSDFEPHRRHATLREEACISSRKVRTISVIGCCSTLRALFSFRFRRNESLWVAYTPPPGKTVQLGTPRQAGRPPCNFVATSTSKTTAVLRIVPQMVRSASVIGGWRSETASSRSLTSLSS